MQRAAASSSAYAKLGRWWLASSLNFPRSAAKCIQQSDPGCPSSLSLRSQHCRDSRWNRLPALAATLLASGTWSLGTWAEESTDTDISTLASPWQHRLVGLKRRSVLDWEEQLKGRVDRQFIWQTCRGKGKIEAIEVYQGTSVHDASNSGSLGTDVVKGKTKVCIVLSTGDELNGHVHIHHGGFTAALLDDLTGMASFMEKTALGLDKSLIFTANLNINYRQKLPDRSKYFVEVSVDRVERQKKVFIEAVIRDETDKVCVDATALYIIKTLA